MNYEQALAYIHSLSQFGSKPGLERVSRLVSLANNPQKSLKFIHIAGTSGKGSCANYCASVLQKAGYKVGLFTSPFVLDFRERFMINGTMILKEDFARLCTQLYPLVKSLNDEGIIITEFEFITVLAFLYFKEQCCDIVCLEVGMGGRFDSTNVIDRPLVSVITRLGLDHTAYLGNTLSEIAFEKCGIVKGGDCVCYPAQKDEALLKIKEICKQCGADLKLAKLSDITDVSLSIYASSFKYKGNFYSLNMTGEHQIHNAVTAICALEVLEKHGFKISQKALYDGLSSVQCAARLEVISREPLVIIDGAHNADKISSLYQSVKDFKGKIISVCAMLRDKDYHTAIKKIAPLCKAIYTVAADNPRSLTANEFAENCRDYCPDVLACDSIENAVSLAFSKMNEGDVFLCWGSLYIAGMVRSAALENLKK